MRKYLLLALLVVSINCIGQGNITFYVAARSGLSLREKKDPNSKLLLNIPYGAKINVNYPDEIVNITLSGIESAWGKTTYAGKTGYVVNTYLLPWPPPKASVQTMKQYFQQLSLPAGAPVILKVGSIEELEAGGSTTKKQLYKNGAEHHEESYYEAGNDIYFIPGFTLQQGFILLRLIPEFKGVFSENDLFPTENKTIKRGDDDYTIKVESDDPGNMYWVKKIRIDYVDGAYYSFEMFLLGGQLVINFGSGI